jgi:FMN phosphatase YigB (HAD superfamily)
MKIVLFDLGDTLEDQKKSKLLPGARKTLRAIQALRDSEGKAPTLALISDFTMPDSPDQIPSIRKQYLAILDHLGIRSFFEPVSKTVTLSTEVGVLKPNKRIFQAVLKKVDGHPGFKDVLFITENLDHVKKARLLKMKAIHFKGPRESTGDVDKLVDLIPLIKRFLASAA